MKNFYNEIDPFAAQWLRNLIEAGHIAPGVVDERSIVDIKPAELEQYTQCHFFAGIGVWSLALRNAGWPDDRTVWTGSCPCQPFSSAGKGVGFDDERHLWPAFQWLIDQCRPAVVLGEQVANKSAEAWIDLVQTDVEAMGYAFGCVPFPSASVGAPHIRDRNYWVAYVPGVRPTWQRGQRESGVAQHKSISRLADMLNKRCEGHAERAEPPGWILPGDGMHPRRVGNPHCNDPRWNTGTSDFAENETSVRGSGDMLITPSAVCNPGPVNSVWRDADWLFCRDGKWRPVEPCTFPLANGITSRMGRLRAYGNAINAVQAQIFIESFIESTYEAAL